ncbi:hypothetical protein BJY04DRAFT_213471 [Aspergillus karnatakaensis]|uniref:uncharacterized protein n=1 Tax=Aspergillus karnatakaensis TaxID=1810916 RepID=UPI003CCCF68C
MSSSSNPAALPSANVDLSATLQPIVVKGVPCRTGSEVVENLEKIRTTMTDEAFMAYLNDTVGQLGETSEALESIRDLMNVQVHDYVEKTMGPERFGKFMQSATYKLEWQHMRRSVDHVKANKEAAQRATKSVEERWGERGKNFLRIRDAQQWRKAAKRLAEAIPKFMVAMPFVVHAVIWRLQHMGPGSTASLWPGLQDLRRAKELFDESPNLAPVNDATLTELKLQINKEGLLDTVDSPAAVLTAEEQLHWRPQASVQASPTGSTSGSATQPNQTPHQTPYPLLTFHQLDPNAAATTPRKPATAVQKKSALVTIGRRDRETTISTANKKGKTNAHIENDMLPTAAKGSPTRVPSGETPQNRGPNAMDSLAIINRATGQLLLPENAKFKLLSDLGLDITNMTGEMGLREALWPPQLFSWFDDELSNTGLTIWEAAAKEWEEFASISNDGIQLGSFQYGLIQQALEIDPVLWTIHAILRGTAYLYALPQPPDLEKHDGKIIVSAVAGMCRVPVPGTDLVLRPTLLTMEDLRGYTGVDSTITATTIIDGLASFRTKRMPMDKRFMDGAKIQAAQWNGSHLFHGVNPLSDAMHGYRSYDEPDVQAHIRVLLSQDREAASTHILNLRRGIRVLVETLWTGRTLSRNANI